jgi:hypothetical protein
MLPDHTVPTADKTACCRTVSLKSLRVVMSCCFIVLEILCGC